MLTLDGIHREDGLRRRAWQQATVQGASSVPTADGQQERAEVEQLSVLGLLVASTCSGRAPRRLIEDGDQRRRGSMAGGGASRARRDRLGFAGPGAHVI
jgi:hypothetical protein